MPTAAAPPDRRLELGRVAPSLAHTGIPPVSPTVASWLLLLQVSLAGKCNHQPPRRPVPRTRRFPAQSAGSSRCGSRSATASRAPVTHYGATTARLPPAPYHASPFSHASTSARGA